MWSNRELNVLSDEVIEHTISQFKDGPSYGNKPAAEHHFDALKRQLDRTQPDYLD
jgi:hypothetical protein